MAQHKFYTNTESAWSGMIEAIRQARSSVYLETYIFEDNTGPDFDFSQALLDQAAQGVKIRIVLDGFGSLFLSGETVRKLRSVGVEVLFFNNWFRRIHRKILIIDNEVAFVGGVSVGQQYRKWLDLNVRLTEKRVVRSLVKSFSRSYFYCGGSDPEIIRFRKSSGIRKTELWLLEHFPWAGKFMLRRYYEEKIAQAKKTIVIVTPYLAPHRWLVRSLALAKARGVMVDIIIPRDSDVWLSTVANHVFASSLCKLGINFYLTRDMIHAKSILIDDRVGLVGSNNLDGLSFDLNVEASVSFEKKEMIRDLKNIIDIWKRDSIPFEHSPQYDKWYYKFIEKIIEFLQPVL